MTKPQTLEQDVFRMIATKIDLGGGKNYVSLISHNIFFINWQYFV